MRIAILIAAFAFGAGNVSAQCQDGFTRLSRKVSGLTPKTAPQPWEVKRSETFDVVLANGLELKNLPGEKAVLVTFPGGATTRIEGVRAYYDHDDSPIGGGFVQIAGEESSEEVSAAGRDYIAMQRESDARSEYIYLESSCDPKDARERPVVYLQPERVEVGPDGAAKIEVGQGKSMWGGWASLSPNNDGSYEGHVKRGGDFTVEALVPALWILDARPDVSRTAFPAPAPARPSIGSRALSNVHRFLKQDVHLGQSY